MLQEFTANARQYYDFTKINEDTENVDSFFDKITEIPSDGIIRKSLTEEMKLDLPNDEDDDGDNSVFYSPMKTHTDTGIVVHSSNLRRSSSVGNLNLPSHGQNERQIRLEFNELKLTKCGSTNSLNKLNNNCSKERINQLAQPKEAVTKSNNFISMAEAVMKFHKSTPRRFRTVEHNTEQSHTFNLGHTKAHTPKLLTKNRTRPVYVLSQEEQEKLDMEEAKKFKIRAHPLNARVLQQPKKAIVLKKPSTAPLPFKLTELTKKAVVHEESPGKTHFRARPVPKTVYQPFEVKHSATVLTKPSTPQCLKKYAPRTVKATPPPSPPQRKDELPLKRTQPVPFSFEKRDEELKKKKEELIKKVNLFWPTS